MLCCHRDTHVITYSNIMQGMALYKGFARITLDCTLDADIVVLLWTPIGETLSENFAA